MRIGLNSPQALLALLIRRRWWIITPFVALTCMVAVLAKSLPKAFVSESMITVQPRDVSADFVVDLIAGTATERVKSIETTVMSRTNLVEVAKEFESRMPELANLSRDKQAEKIRGQIGIKYPTNPLKPNQQLPITYFKISFSNQDPGLAQAVTQRLTELFIAEDRNKREDQVAGAQDFLAGELARVDRDLSVAEDALKKLKAANLSQLPERLETNQRMLESVLQQARNIDDLIFKNAEQKLTYEQLMASLPETVPARTLVAAAVPRYTLNNSSPQKAPAEDQKILDYRKIKQAFRDEAASKPAGNPDVLRAQAVLDRARKGLSPEELEIAENPPAPPALVSLSPALSLSPTLPGMPETPAVEPNPALQKLKEQYHLAEIEQQNLQKQKKDTANRVAQYTQRIELTPQVENDLAEVFRDRDSLQRQHDEIKGKLSKVQLSASLESQQKGGQFQIQDKANKPSTPTTPSKPLIALAGSAISLLLSVVFAVIVDIARQRIWTQKEIETFWGVPVLVDIPEILTDTDLVVARKKKWVFAASAAGAAVVYSICLYGVHLNRVFILRQLDPVLQKFIN